MKINEFKLFENKMIKYIIQSTVIILTVILYNLNSFYNNLYYFNYFSIIKLIKKIFQYIKNILIFFI